MIAAGGMIEWLGERGPLEGAVAYARTVGDRQLLTVAMTDGSLRTLFVIPPAGETDGIVLAEVSGARAERLAEAVLNGFDPRIPVQTQLMVLAAAVLANAVNGEEIDDDVRAG